MDRADVEAGITRDVEAWQTAGTEPLGTLFAPEATYSHRPWVEPERGLAALASFWEAQRDGPEEEFTFDHEIVAVDGDTAVVRVDVVYGNARSGSWKDLWVIRFDDDGRAITFEEWPFAPPKRRRAPSRSS